MKTFSLFSIFLVSLLISYCSETSIPSEGIEQKTQQIDIIRIDREMLSGIGLKAVQNSNQPDRRLFQKKLIGGNDLSVYVVSSETASAAQENMAMEEFIFLINGQSKMSSANGESITFQKGDSFIAPKGFTGQWETIGGDEFLIELSVIATKRNDSNENLIDAKPYLIDKNLRSGVSLASGSNSLEGEIPLYQGVDLSVTISNRLPGKKIIEQPMQEQLVEVLSGKVTTTAYGNKPQTFLTGDYYLIPGGFTGSFDYQAHGNFRCMVITKS